MQEPSLKLGDEDDRRKILKRVVDNNLNVKQTEKLIEDFLEGKEEVIQKEKQN